MVQRGAAGVLRVAVSLWPAEERHWGRAISAELDEIEGAWNSVAWAAGGVVVWMRALAKSFLQSLGRPLGVGADPATQELLGRTAGVLRTPRWATAQVDTIRLRLLKIAAQVRVTARRIWIRYSRSYPWKQQFAAAWVALRC